jgi:hypothetical protein
VYNLLLGGDVMRTGSYMKEYTWGPKMIPETPAAIRNYSHVQFLKYWRREVLPAYFHTPSNSMPAMWEETAIACEKDFKRRLREDYTAFIAAGFEVGH